jgi:hypothetical protein
VGTLFVGDEIFELARRAYERSESDPPEAVVALILSAVSFEVLLNEMVEFALSSLSNENEPEEVKTLASILKDLEQQRAQLGLKVQIAYYILKKKKLNKGEPLYQDFDLLMNLRNTLVHKKPEKWTWTGDDQEYEPHKLVKQLADRKVISLPSSNEPPLLFIIICSPDVARWSYNVAVRMVKFLVDLVPPSQLRKSLTSYMSIETI